MHLPSAGMIRFRFNGFACASQPLHRAPRGADEHSAERAARTGGLLLVTCRCGGRREVGLGDASAGKPIARELAIAACTQRQANAEPSGVRDKVLPPTIA